MAFNSTPAVIKDRLTEINQLGLYSFTMFDGLSPILGSVLFGPEMLGLAKSKNVNMRNLYMDATTLTDGRTLKWRRLKFTNIRTDLTVAVTAGNTTLNVTTTEGFSPGDQIKLIDLITNDEEVVEVVAVPTATTLTLNTGTADAYDVGDAVIRISYSKIKGKEIDRNDYDFSDDETDNYIQDFGTQKDFCVDEINSHIEVGDYMSSANSLRGAHVSKDVNDVKRMIDTHLGTIFARKVGIEMIGDIGRAFYGGVKNKITIGGDTRWYTGGLQEATGGVVTELDYTGATINSDPEELFRCIWEKTWDVKFKSSHYGNRNVVIAGNEPFNKMFATLASDKVIFDTVRSEYGYELTTLTFPGQMGAVNIVHDPLIDQLGPQTDTPEFYVLPLDLISAHRRFYNDMSGMQNASDLKQGSPDIMIKKSVKSEDTLDTFKFYFAFNLGFVFGGWEDDIYARCRVVNYDFC